jgi:AAA15 family ATPase/GTPase
MVPMPQMGQGVQHLIRIFSQLIAEGSDACLIDEIENGIHHSMLEQVWSGIATASVGLGTQVFATTHSYECVEAAHAAFSKRESYDLRIIQLFRVAEGVQGRVLDRKHIEAALDGQIDLR